MDQELKQRLIGAAVITALAAIFVPMLFDDPIDDTGKNINALKIPELPAKVQDVEIAPLPEKVEDVVSSPPSEKSLKSASAMEENGADEIDVESPRPYARLSAKDTSVSVKRQQVVEPDTEAVADEDVPVAEAQKISPVVKQGKLPAKPVQSPPAVSTTNTAPRVLKPSAKPPEPPPVENTVKPTAPSAANESGTRWYLNAGTFTQKSNAVELLDKLKQQGFPALVKEVAVEKSTVYKVRIGPMMDKAKAQAVKSKLTQINITSFVSPDE